MGVSVALSPSAAARRPPELGRVPEARVPAVAAGWAPGLSWAATGGIRRLISYKMQRVPHPLFLYGINIIIMNIDGSKTLA